MEMLGEIFAAADAQVRAAGGLLAGGHTIRDAEPKYGLAVVGTVRPDGIWPKNGARPGDVALPDEAARHGADHDRRTRTASPARMQLERAIRWMRTLNKDAADVLRGVEPNAVTDVTGFGLFGHAHEMAESQRRPADGSSRSAFPAIDGALDLARNGVRTSGDPRNRDFAAAHVATNGLPETLDRARVRPANGGRPAGLAAGRARAPRSRRSSSARKLFIRRIGRVEEGTGVVVE